MKALWTSGIQPSVILGKLQVVLVHIDLLVFVCLHMFVLLAVWKLGMSKFKIMETQYPERAL